MNKRPKNLNLFTIRLPVNALVSILHRVSGCLLFMLLPLTLWIVTQTLYSPQSYATLLAYLHSGSMRALGVVIAWAFFHHLFAGIRHLVMDMRGTPSLVRARFTGRVVLALGGLATLAWILL